MIQFKQGGNPYEKLGIGKYSIPKSRKTGKTTMTVNAGILFLSTFGKVHIPSKNDIQNGRIRSKSIIDPDWNVHRNVQENLINLIIKEYKQKLIWSVNFRMLIEEK